MDHETHHQGDWLELRCHYAFALYDDDADQHLTAAEFTNMIREIRRMKQLSIESHALEEAVKEEASKFPPRAKISFADFADRVKQGAFRGTSFLFRFEVDFRRVSPLSPLPVAAGPPSSPHTPAAKGHLLYLPNSHAIPSSETSGLKMTQNQQQRTQQQQQQQGSGSKVRFHTRRVVVDNPNSPSPKKAVQLLNTANCPHALKKVENVNQPFSSRMDLLSNNGVHEIAQNVVHGLLLLREGSKILAEDPFTLCGPNDVNILCQEAARCCLADAMMVEVQGTVKVFGDIHGQLYDLLALFDAYGSPNDVMGDIDDISYVFLGDFVDRGPYSLEVVSLLCSLKVLYPTRVFLIRGNHEDRTMNSQYGFKVECQRRLHHLGPDVPDIFVLFLLKLFICCLSFVISLNFCWLLACS